MASSGGQRVHAIFKVKASGRTRIIVFDTQDLSLGRSSENDLAIDEPEMSRKHAIFKRSPQGCRVEDMGTSNGTEVNGESVDRAGLSHGDVIRIGEVEITFAETTRNPASLGASVEYASQLKSFGSPMAGRHADGEATILGLVDTPGAGGDEDELDVRPAGEFDLELNAARPPGSRPRNLDAEIADLDGDDGLGALDLRKPAAPGRATAAAEPDPVWTLEDEDLAPAPEQAKPAPVAPARPPVAGRLALTLEIEGAEGELRRILAGLAGKVLEIPSLRVRVKADDLG